MAETAEFDEFVTARSRHLLRVAHLLTGDHGLAEDLLQTALARSWSAWRRLDGNPEPYVRQVLLNTYNSWWRRRWNGERPTDLLPERAGPSPQASVDERDQVWRALSRLSRQQRTVLVLRYFEDLSEAEIAQTLHISPGAVKSHASKGLARLRLDPSLRELPRPEAEDAPAGNERLAAVHGRIAQRRRSRIAAVAAACVVVLAAIAGYAVAPHLRSRSLPDPATSEQPGPRYLDGRRVLAAKAGQPTKNSAVHLNWVPEPSQGPDLDIFVECADGLPGSTVNVHVRVNDEEYGSAPCGDVAQVRWFKLRAKAGLPVVVSAIVGGACMTRTPSTLGGVVAADCRPAPMPESGTLVLGIGERVPFDRYPLPAPPAELPALEPHYQRTSTVPLRPGAESVSLVWLGPLMIDARAQTPGRLHVHVDGRLVGTLDFWDYEQDGASLNYPAYGEPDPGIARGTTVTVTLVPDRLAGDWFAALQSVGPPL